MVRKFRSVKPIVIVFFLVMLLGGNCVWASPKDAAECKKYASGEYPSPIFAITPCSRQIESSPDDLESVFWRGVAYFKRGSSSQNDYQSALADFNKVLGTYPNDMQALENRASCYLELKRYEEAIADASEVIASDCKALGSFMVRAKALFWLNRYEESLSDYTAALALNPRNENTKFDAFLWRGSCNRWLKKYEQAVVDYRNALAVQPSHTYINRNIADCLVPLGRKREAIDALKAYISTYVEPELVKPGTAHTYYVQEKVRAKAKIEELSK